MIITRAIVGLTVLAVGCAAMQCLFYLDWGMKYHGLGPLWEKGYVEFPLLSQGALVIAPIGWWSVASCVFMGIGAALRPRTALRWADLIALVFGALLLWISTVGATKPFFMVVYYMGYPVELLNSPGQWAGNIVLTLTSLLWMVWSMRDLRGRSNPPNKTRMATPTSPSVSDDLP